MRSDRPRYLPPDAKVAPRPLEPTPAPGFGTVLHELIARHRLPDGSAWTLQYFATLIGVSEPEVRSWIEGAVPDGETLARIGQALLVDPDALLDGEIQPPTLATSERTTRE
jgi:hypothetical protein